MIEGHLKDIIDAEEEIPAERIAPITVAGFRVDEILFTHGFVHYCDISKCGGGCCHSGVYADLGEQAAILAHAAEIGQAMDDTQDTDPETWFDGDIIEDSDFPSGHAIGTEVQERDGGISGFTEGCVFLDKRHFCSIQVAAANAGLHRWEWKPKYCILFPVTVVQGILTYDDGHSDDLIYCGPAGEGNYVHSIFEAMQEELRYFLGDLEFEKLKAYYHANRERFETECFEVARRNERLIQIAV